MNYEASDFDFELELFQVLAKLLKIVGLFSKLDDALREVESPVLHLFVAVAVSHFE